MVSHGVSCVLVLVALVVATSAVELDHSRNQWGFKAGRKEVAVLKASGNIDLPDESFAYRCPEEDWRLVSFRGDEGDVKVFKGPKGAMRRWSKRLKASRVKELRASSASGRAGECLWMWNSNHVMDEKVTYRFSDGETPGKTLAENTDTSLVRDIKQRQEDRGFFSGLMTGLKQYFGSIVRPTNKKLNILHYELNADAVTEYLARGGAGGKIAPNLYDGKVWGAVFFGDAPLLEANVGGVWMKLPTPDLAFKTFIYVKQTDEPDKKGYLLLSDEFRDSMMDAEVSGCKDREPGVKCLTAQIMKYNPDGQTFKFKAGDGKTFQASWEEDFTDLTEEQDKFWEWASQHDYKFEVGPAHNDPKKPIQSFRGKVPQDRDVSTARHTRFIKHDGTLWSRYEDFEAKPFVLFGYHVDSWRFTDVAASPM